MKTIVRETIETNVQKIQLGYWDVVNEVFVPITDKEGAAEEAARLLNCSTALIEVLQMLTGDIKDRLMLDLVDIWQRLDKLEKFVNRNN